MGAQERELEREKQLLKLRKGSKRTNVLKRSLKLGMSQNGYDNFGLNSYLFNECSRGFSQIYPQEN